MRVPMSHATMRGSGPIAENWMSRTVSVSTPDYSGHSGHCWNCCYRMYIHCLSPRWPPESTDCFPAGLRSTQHRLPR